MRVRLIAGTNITSISGTYPNLTINAAAQTTDTSSLSTRINARVKYTDTSSMLSAYQTAINAKGNGTVTSVATGLGLSGGAITTTGTLLVDTSSASIISRQRAAATYTLISDTSLFARKQMPSYSIRVNNTNATANATTDNYKTVAETALGASDSVTYVGTTAPSGTTNNTYHLSQIGDRVFGEIILANTVNGAGITSIVVKLPSAFPSPKKPTGATSANQFIYNANATLSNATNTSISASLRANLRNNYNNTATEVVLNFLSSAFANTFISFTYPTD
jgi:hypothetical protein